MIQEQIKGWKNAHSDIAKWRSMKDKKYYTHRLTKDGSLSKMHDAKVYHDSIEKAKEYSENVKKLNPNIKHKMHAIIDMETGKEVNEGISIPRYNAIYEAIKASRKRKKNKIIISPTKKILHSAIGYI